MQKSNEMLFYPISKILLQKVLNKYSTNIQPYVRWGHHDAKSCDGVFMVFFTLRSGKLGLLYLACAWFDDAPMEISTKKISKYHQKSGDYETVNTCKE